MQPRRATPIVAFVAFVALLAGCAPSAELSTGEGGTNAKVLRVVDGDTVDVRVAGREERIRLIGIDTPESVRPDTPVECFGPEASAFTAALLPPGTSVRIERDLEPRDVYDRLLAYVYLADGTFVNLEIVRTGHATTLSIEPNTAHASDFAAAERSARRAGAGLWGTCSG